MDDSGFLSAIPGKKYIGVGVILILAILFISQIVDTVQSGTYHIKQAAITGDMTAKMKPGMYPLLFGTNVVWPIGETYLFTDGKDIDGDSVTDNSIGVQFNDGSIARLAGTVRIVLPTNPTDAIGIITIYGYINYNTLRDKSILPNLRKALRNTASLMTAQESYATRRTDFQVWATDQLENGMYILREETRQVKTDESCIDTQIKPCERKDVRYKIIATNPDGTYQREARIFPPGVRVLNLEIKTFGYEDKVRAQIAGQQDAMMRVQTAIANTKKLEQQKIEAEALGKKAVMEAQYAEEELKVKALVQANRDKEVAELQAQQRKNVAKLDKEAAEYTKQKLTLEGEGEAAKKKLILAADGALQQKLDAWKEAQIAWANAYKERKVPTWVTGGSSSGKLDNDTSEFMSMMQLLTAKSLGLNLSIPQK